MITRQVLLLIAITFLSAATAHPITVAHFDDDQCTIPKSGGNNTGIFDPTKDCNTFSYVDKQGVTTYVSVNNFRCAENSVTVTRYIASQECNTDTPGSFKRDTTFTIDCSWYPSHEGSDYAMLVDYTYPGSADCLSKRHSGADEDEEHTPTTTSRAIIEVAHFDDDKCTIPKSDGNNTGIFDPTKDCNTMSYVDGEGVRTYISMDNFRCSENSVTMTRYIFSQECNTDTPGSFRMETTYSTDCSWYPSHEGSDYAMLVDYTYPGSADCLSERHSGAGEEVEVEVEVEELVGVTAAKEDAVNTKYADFTMAFFSDAQCTDQKVQQGKPFNVTIPTSEKKCFHFTYVDSAGVTFDTSLNNFKCFEDHLTVSKYPMSADCASGAHSVDNYVISNHCNWAPSHEGGIYEKLFDYKYPGHEDCSFDEVMSFFVRQDLQ